MVEAAVGNESEQKQFQLVPNIATGLLLSFIDFIFAISLSSLIFSGPLADHLARGIGIIIITSIIHAIFSVLFSSSHGLISIVQDNPAVIISVAIASLVGITNPGEDQLAVTIAYIFLATLLTGVFLLLLGTFKLGVLVRYIPYPVIGGFLAGTGWLLIRGSFGTMSDYPLYIDTIGDLLAVDQVQLWLPGVLLGVPMFWGMHRFRHPLVMPAFVIGWLILFFVGLILAGTSIDEATEQGLFLGNGSSALVVQAPVEIFQADWMAIFSRVGNIGAILLMSAVDLLLNITAIELIMHRDIDLNKQLKSMGWVNILSAGAGAMVGYHSLAVSALPHRQKANHRFSAAVLALVFIAALFLGTSVLTYIPKALIGGVLLMLGMDFMYDWVVVGRKKLNRMDYAAIWVILLAIALLGYLAGVVIGLLIMSLLFVIRYSQLDIFHRVASGAEITSHMERNAYHERILREMGTQTYILQLEEYLFFGTANLILEKVRVRLEDTTLKPLTFLILDFRRVSGLDSSAVLSFNKIYNLANTHGFVMILTHLTSDFERDLMRNELTLGEHLKIFPDLDHGLEWCENALLESNEVTNLHLAASLELQLEGSGFDRANTQRLKSYLEYVEFEPGEYLVHQGDAADTLYFIELGRVSIYLELENGKRVRLRTMDMGTVVGELGFFQSGGRSASVIADENTIAYRLERPMLDEMSVKDPALTIAFQQLIMRIVAERLKSTNRELGDN